jgi:hypothetical protein
MTVALVSFLARHPDDALRDGRNVDISLLTLYTHSGAVALATLNDTNGSILTAWKLLEDAGDRQRLSLAGGKLYRDSFGLQHTINTLRRP